MFPGILPKLGGDTATSSCCRVLFHERTHAVSVPELNALQLETVHCPQVAEEFKHLINGCYIFLDALHRR